MGSIVRPNLAWYDGYVEAFNSQDPQRFAMGYFSPDIIFERRDYRFTRGRDAYISEFYATHDGLSEILEPLRVVTDDTTVAVEMNVHFAATKDQPDFILGPMRAGDAFLCKLAVFYTVIDGSITYVKSFRWNPGQP